MADVISLENVGHMVFNTLNDHKLHLIYDCDTTIGDIMSQFWNNYKCQNIDNNDILFLNKKDNTQIDFSAVYDSTPQEIGIPKNIDIVMKQRPYKQTQLSQKLSTLTIKESSETKKDTVEENTNTEKVEKNTQTEKHQAVEKKTDDTKNINEEKEEEYVEQKFYSEATEFILRFKKSDKILSIRKQILEKLSFDNISNFILTIGNSKILDDDCKFSEYVKEITNNTNKLIVQKINVGEVFVKTLSGSLCIIKVSSNTTIEELKQLYYDKYGTPVDLQRLIFLGKQLEDNKTVADYNINTGSTLHLVLRLRGGMYHEVSGKNGGNQPLKNCVIFVNVKLSEKTKKMLAHIIL